MLIQTTQDLFWLLSGISILLFTIFVCWGLFYLIMTVKDIRNVTKDIKNKIKLIEDFIITAKDKLSDSSKYLKGIVDAVAKVTAWLATKDNYNEENKTAKKEKRKKLL